MVDFSVLPKARPAPEVYSDIRAKAKVPELDHVLFPFYFADMRKEVTNTGWRGWPEYSPFRLEKH